MSLTTGAFSVRYLARVDAAKESSTVPTNIAFCSSPSCPLVLASESLSLHVTSHDAQWQVTALQCVLLPMNAMEAKLQACSALQMFQR